MAKEGTHYRGDFEPLAKGSDVEYNLSDIPFFVNISITFRYKEPVMIGSDVDFEDICIYTTRNPLYKESIQAAITGINLTLYTYIDEQYAFPEVDFHTDSFKDGCYPNIVDDFFTMQLYVWNIKDIKELHYDYGVGHKMWYSLYQKDPLEIHYDLNYSVGDISFPLTGEADFSTPIRVLDSVEEMNVNINRTILTLTGWLIIIGSFPFFLSLKQLLEKDR